MVPGRDRTCDPWICSQTRICSQTSYRLCYAAQSNLQSKSANIRNRYNQVTHLTQDGKCQTYNETPQTRAKSLIITCFSFSRNFENENLLGTHKMLVLYPVLVAEQAELIATFLRFNNSRILGKYSVPVKCIKANPSSGLGGCQF